MALPNKVSTGIILSGAEPQIAAVGIPQGPFIPGAQKVPINPKPRQGGLPNMAVSELLGASHEEEEKHDEKHEDHKMDPAAYKHLEDGIEHMKKGALHRELGVPIGDTIPHDKLERASHSSDHLLARRARFALTMEGWHHGHSGPHDSEFHHSKKEDEDEK